MSILLFDVPIIMVHNNFDVIILVLIIINLLLLYKCSLCCQVHTVYTLLIFYYPVRVHHTLLARGPTESLYTHKHNII